MSHMPTSPDDSQLARLIAEDLGVAQRYRHIGKQVLCLEPLQLPSAAVKWYEVFPPDQPIPEAVRQLARSPLLSGAVDVKGLGFVILHRCNADFYFLIACTWRNENEVWETVWYKNGNAMPEFAPFSRDEPHKPTFCVWELVPLWHEQQAWIRFLLSARDAMAARHWLDDVYQGQA